MSDCTCGNLIYELGEHCLNCPQHPLRAEALAEAEAGTIHAAFGLSYASYLVIPRTVLQSMPVEWQREFVRLVDQTHVMFPGWEPDGYRVHALDKRGKVVKDPLADYERGRRRLEPSCGGGYNEEKP